MVDAYIDDEMNNTSQIVISYFKELCPYRSVAVDLVVDDLHIGIGRSVRSRFLERDTQRVTPDVTLDRPNDGTVIKAFDR